MGDNPYKINHRVVGHHEVGFPADHVGILGIPKDYIQGDFLPDININLVLAWLDPGTTYFNLGSMDAAPMILSSIAALVGTEFSYGCAAKQTCWMS